MFPWARTSLLEKNLLSPYQPERNLRSATKGLLEENGYKLETYGRRAYFVVGPSFWNDLPADLRFEDDLTCLNLVSKPIFSRCLPKTQIPIFIDT